MGNPIFGVLQRVGKAFMLPIALLPVAGLLLGIGASFTNETMLMSYGLMGVMGPGTLLFSLLSIMKNAGDIVFANLPILFAMGVAAGMANSEKEVATLSGAVAYFVMHATINAMLGINGKLAADALHAGSLVPTVGIMSLQMGVFGGILVGFGVAALHNRYHKHRVSAGVRLFRRKPFCADHLLAGVRGCGDCHVLFMAHGAKWDLYDWKPG